MPKPEQKPEQLPLWSTAWLRIAVSIFPAAIPVNCNLLEVTAKLVEPPHVCQAYIRVRGNRAVFWVALRNQHVEVPAFFWLAPRLATLAFSANARRPHGSFHSLRANTGTAPLRLRACFRAGMRV